MKTYYVYILASRPGGEMFPHVRDAIQREKSIKKWPRVWKTRLITEYNAEWRDLYQEIAK